MTLKTLSVTNFQSFELPLRQQDLPNNVKCTPPPIALSLEFWNKPGDVVRMEFVTVYRGLSMAEAELVRSRLEANQFLVNVKNEDASFAIGGQAMAAGGIMVQVPEDQVDSARALLDSDPPSS